MIGESGKRLNKRLGKHKQVTRNNDDADHIDELHLKPTLTTELTGSTQGSGSNRAYRIDRVLNALPKARTR